METITKIVLIIVVIILSIAYFKQYKELKYLREYHSVVTEAHNHLIEPCYEQLQTDMAKILYLRAIE